VRLCAHHKINFLRQYGSALRFHKQDIGNNMFPKPLAIQKVVIGDFENYFSSQSDTFKS
jgi:hypothetical protein